MAKGSRASDVRTTAVQGPDGTRHAVRSSRTWCGLDRFRAGMTPLRLARVDCVVCIARMPP